MKKIFKADNYSISYLEKGKGPAVVLLHGFGEDGTIFNHQLDALSDNYHVIIPDIPGTGDSVIDYNKVESDMDMLADCIKSLLDYLQINKVVLLGHSMGGYITLSFAEKYADRLYAFGLIHSTAFADTEEKKLNRSRGIEIMRLYGAAGFLRNTFPNLFSSEYKSVNHDELNNLITQFSYISTDTCIYYYKAMIARKDKTMILKTITLPVLFVIGEEDIAAPMADVLQQVPMPAVSFVHILKNTGHMSMVEAPDKLNSILKDFLDDISAFIE